MERYDRQLCGRAVVRAVVIVVLSIAAAAPAADQAHSVYSVCFTPDGKQLLSGGASRRIQLWNVATGREIRSFEHPGWMQSVAVSPDGRRGLTGTRNRTMRLWDLATGKMLREFKHGAWVTCVLFSADGKTCISVGGDDTKKGEAGVRVWDPETGTQVRKFKMPPKKPGKWGNSLGWASMSADGKLLATCGRDVIIWDVAKGEPIHTFDGAGKLVWEVALSPDGKWCAAGSMDKTIKVWDAAAGRLVKTIRHTAEVRAVTFSPDGGTLAVGDLRGQVRFWRLPTFAASRPIRAHKFIVESLHYSPDGKTIVSGSFDNTIKLWDARSGRLIRAFAGKEPPGAKPAATDPAKPDPNADAKRRLAQAEKRIEKMHQAFLQVRAKARPPAAGPGRIIGFVIDADTGRLPAGATKPRGGARGALLPAASGRASSADPPAPGSLK